MEINKLRLVDVKSKDGLLYQNNILIENIEELNFYLNNNFSNRITDAAKDLINAPIENRHYINRTAGAADIIAKAKGGGSLTALMNLSDTISRNLFEHILNGKKILINQLGGYHFLNDGDSVELLNDYVYTEKDISISKFEGGKHFYAKIGDINVYDKYGDYKWNTHEYAEKTAIQFLNDLNSKKNEKI